MESANKDKLPIEEAFGEGAEDLLVLWSANAGNSQPSTRECVARLVCGALAAGGENVWFGFGDNSGMTKKDGTPQCSRIGEMDSWLGPGALEAARKGPEAFGAVMDAALGNHDFSCMGGTDLTGLLINAGEHTDWRPRKIIMASLLNDKALAREKMPREAGDWLSLSDVFMAMPNGERPMHDPASFFGTPCVVKRHGVFDAYTLCELSTALALKKTLIAELPLGSPKGVGKTL